MELTQTKVVKKFYDHNGFWTCPCCKTTLVGPPRIENLGEEKTQVYCAYARQYVFLDDYIVNLKIRKNGK